MNDITFNFTGNNYVVVGASSGIGRQVVLDIADSGGRVLAIARNSERLLSVAEEYPQRIVPKSIDIRNRELLNETLDDFTAKNGKLKGSVYTAGISKTTAIRTFPETDARELMDINFWGWINLMNIMSKRKISENGCSNVVISSVAAQTGEAGNFAYNASKAAIDTCVRTFAKELSKRGCRVNSIRPGFVATSLTEDYFSERGFSEKVIEKHLLGLGSPKDVSGLVCFLLSDRAKWVTGTNYTMDGGYLVSD